MKLSSSPSSSPVPKFKLRRVELRGAPFKNPRTVRDLIIQCVPKLTFEDAERIATTTSESASVIVCLEKDAHEYCRNLIDNGLESVVTS